MSLVRRKTFNDTFLKKEEIDVMLLQPNLIQDIPDEQVDPIQRNYFSLNGFDDSSSFADLPVEANWGLMALGNSLEKHGFKSVYIDLNLFDYIKKSKTSIRINDSDIAKILQAKDAKVYGISSMTASYHTSIKLAQMIKRLFPNSYVVLGGIHPSLYPEQTLRDFPAVDFVVKGEGETSLPALLLELKAGKNKKQFKKIPGICYLDNGAFVINPPSLLDLITEDTPLDLGFWPSDVPFTPRINLSRGCVGSCSYCSANRFFDGKYRIRTLDNIITDIKTSIASGYKKILMGDLSFGCNKQIAVDICKYIIRNSIETEWWCQMRITDCDSDLLKIMAEAGCKQIALGFESAETNILEGVSAKKTKKNNRSVFDVCQEINDLGIALQGYFILGLPGETMDSAIKTIHYMEDLLPYNMSYVHISLAVPFPGTDMYEHPEKYDIEIVDMDWDHYLMNSDLNGVSLPVFDGKSLSRYQSYALWELALATASKYFKKKALIPGAPLADIYKKVYCEALW